MIVSRRPRLGKSFSFPDAPYEVQNKELALLFEEAAKAIRRLKKRATIDGVMLITGVDNDTIDLRMRMVTE